MSKKEWDVEIELVDNTKTCFKIDFSFIIESIIKRLSSLIDPITFGLIKKSEINNFTSILNYISNLNVEKGFICSFQYLCIKEECFNISFKFN